jgi:hypothetical protein
MQPAQGQRFASESKTRPLCDSDDFSSRIIFTFSRRNVFMFNSLGAGIDLFKTLQFRVNYIPCPCGIAKKIVSLVSRFHGAIRCTPAMEAGVEKCRRSVAARVERCGE